jgi:exodeoxyribonuclease VII small subunit
MTKKTFRDAYDILQRHAETLRSQREPNIDDLLKIVTESVDAYKVCKSRIEAVEAALEQALGGSAPADGDPVSAARSPATASPPKAATGVDDDIPF